MPRMRRRSLLGCTRRYATPRAGRCAARLDHTPSPLILAPIWQVYGDVFEDAATCVLTWRRRYRGNPKLWKRLMRSDKLVKELVECAPVIAAVRALVDGYDLAEGETFTIVDLCSGKVPSHGASASASPPPCPI